MSGYLPAQEIHGAVGIGTLGIDPYDDTLVGPASVDLLLSNELEVLVPRAGMVLDPADDTSGEWATVVLDATGGAFDLHPGMFALGCTYETITLPHNMIGRVEGKSSLGRIGLQVHSTAGFIDPGFVGQITLELSVVVTVPVRVYPGMRIAQLSLAYLDGYVPTTRPYGEGIGSHYQGQHGPTPARSARFRRGLPYAVTP